MKQPLLILTCLLSFFSFSQSDKLVDYKNAVDTLFFSDINSALAKSNLGLELAYTENDTFHITYFLDQAGELNRMHGNYDLAIKQLNTCLNYKVGWEDLKDLSLTYNNLGKTYTQKGNYEQAIYNFIEALKLMETDKNLIGQAFYLNNIGAVYDLQHNYFKALNYYEQSLDIKYSLKDTNGIAASSTNVGITYFNLEKYEIAVQYHKKAYQIYKGRNLPTKTARSLSNIGKSYIKLGDLDNAKKYLNLAIGLEQKHEFNDQLLVITLNNNLGFLFLKQENVDSAHFYNTKSYDLAKTCNSFQGIKDAASLQSLIYQKQNLLTKAIEQERISNNYNDSLINEANIYAAAEMESKYNLEKKEKEIQAQKFEIQKQKLEKEKAANQKKFYIALLLAVLILMGLLYYYYIKKKQINTLLLTQNNLVKNKNENLEQIKQELIVELKDKTEILEKVFTKNQSKNLPPELLSLSKREMQVLASLALGHSDQEISDKLFISKSTTKTHLRRIYSKLLVNGRAGAVAIAHKYDIIGNLDIA